MKFTCKAINLKEGILKVERIVSKQITLPILANIMLSSENGRLALAATNLEIAIKTYIGAKIENDGQITVPARIVGGFLNNIREDVVSGELSGTDLEIKSQNHRLKIKGMDAKDFPLIPEMPKNILISISPKKLSAAIASVLVSVAHNDTRQELNGIYIKLEKEALIFASTDSFRLSEVVIPLDEKSISQEYLHFIEKNPSIIVPAQTLAELQRIMDGEETLQISIEQNQLFVRNNNFKIISRMINGNYPEYRQVLPKKYDITVKVDRDDLINAVKIASLVANNQNGEVKISNSADKQHLLVSAQSMDTGDNLSKIAADIDGPDFEVIFNCRYLSEGLNIAPLAGEEIMLKLNQQKSPVLIRGIDKERKEIETVSYVVMPIIKG
jgi:DNA polymerase-3 subunit beta